MRYFVTLAYKGTAYHGWQKQPNGISVQQVLEEAFSLMLRQAVEVVGCGRTDSGVHASYYVLHFDFAAPLPENFIYRLNKFLPKDIAIYDIKSVPEQAHARFDAVRRSYEYHLNWQKNPFSYEGSWHMAEAQKLNRDKMAQMARLILDYQEFFPFCKAHSDAKTMKCDLFRSEWVWDDAAQKAVYHVSANRFLRGMVRLLVGTAFQLAQGRLELEQVQQALEQQSRLPKAYSAPPEGLFLTEVIYEAV